jgi:hypothetical protein
MRRALIVAVPTVLLLLSPRELAARTGIRPLFEPTDLELEEPGTIEVDVQAGAIRGQSPWRIVVPDFELDFGLMRGLELDIDGAYSVQESPPGSLSFNQAAPESLWCAAKIGLFDWADDDGDKSDAARDRVVSWALGTQLGPRLPVAPGTHGIGAEGLLLVGHVIHRAHLVLNTGAFVDPSPAPGAGRPVGLEAGLDLDRDIDAAGHFAVTAELSGVRFISADPNQVLVTAGLAWSPVPATQITVTGLWGFLAGSDRYGALLGVSQKIQVFHQR